VYVKNANGCISENAITVPSFAPFSWNGASWNNCALPTKTDYVSFTGNYTLSNSGVIRQFGNVSVSTGVVITIAPGEKMDVQDLALAGTAKIIIQADATGYGQLKINGTLSGMGTVKHQQYVPSLGWHMVSSSTTNGFGTTTGATASNLMPYNASSGAWSSSLGGVGTGYFGHVDASSSSAFMSAAGAFSVEGTPNTSHTFNLGYATAVASGGAGNGWNLIWQPVHLYFECFDVNRHECQQWSIHLEWKRKWFRCFELQLLQWFRFRECPDCTAARILGASHRHGRLDHHYHGFEWNYVRILDLL